MELCRKFQNVRHLRSAILDCKILQIPKGNFEINFKVQEKYKKENKKCKEFEIKW